MVRLADTPDDKLRMKSLSGKGSGVSSRALSAAKKRLDTLGERGALQNARDVISKATKGGRKIAEDSAEETAVWRAVGSKGNVNLGGLRQLIRGASKGLLSPAGLAEEVSGRVAAGASKKKFVDDAKKEDRPSKSGLKRPRTKS